MSVVTTAITVDLDGQLIEAEVVRSDRARVTRIQIGRDRPLRVVIPAGASDDFAREALLVKRAWVTNKLRSVEEVRPAPGALGLDNPRFVWVAGRALPVVPTGGRFAREDEGALLVPTGDAGRAAVRRWYRRRARGYLRELVEEEARRLDSFPVRVVVRDQRTRWGSCAVSGTVSLNWRLLVAPEAVARYVVAHELVHLEVPNHSKAFWRKLSAACPSWQEQAGWLRQHGDELRRYHP